MPQTLHCVILYSENFHHDDQKAAKKAGIETLVIANFHYTDKIKAVDIQYKAADNDKGLQICAFNWRRPGIAHANVPDGPKQVAKGYKAALKKMKPSVRLERCVARLSLPTFHPLTILDCACRSGRSSSPSRRSRRTTSCTTHTIKLLKEKKDENEYEEVVLSDDSSHDGGRLLQRRLV
jgi:hypothetical protein